MGEIMEGCWYVETLLLDRERIKCSIIDRTNEIANSYVEASIEIDLYNEDYNNLLLIEKAIRSLHESGTLSDLEHKVLIEIGNKPILDLVNELSLSRLTLMKVFSRACTKVGFMLGGIFTNEGFLDYMMEKYNLSYDNLENMKKFIHSNKKHLTLRKRRSNEIN